MVLTTSKLSGSNNQNSQNKSLSTILVVDDNPSMRETLSELLFDPAYRIIEAVDGADAIAQARLEKPDLILLDVMMPEMDGFTVCENLRADPALAEVSIVMITALDDREARIKGILSGADDFLTKPIDAQILWARVRTNLLLNRYRSLVEERAKFEWVVEQSADGIIIVDKNDRIEYLNAQARRQFDITSPKVPKTKLLELFELHYNLLTASAWETWPISRQQTTSSSDAASKPSGFLVRPATSVSRAFWLEVKVFDIGVVAGGERIIQLRDVTNCIAEYQNIYQVQAQISHKLCTPLSAVLGSLELLNEYEMDPAFKDQSELISLALQGGRKLNEILMRIIEYNELAETAAGSQRLGLDKIASVINNLQEELNLDDIHVRNLASPGSLSISPAHLNLIFTELLTNAVKFHPDHKPKIDITTEDINGGTVRISIRDDGQVLSPEQLERIWMPYYQGERHFTGQVHGMGLGLPLVAILVWSAGGACIAHNREDRHGLVVEITLPRH